MYTLCNLILEKNIGISICISSKCVHNQITNVYCIYIYIMYIDRY